MGRIRKKQVRGFKDTSLESFFIVKEAIPFEPKKYLKDATLQARPDSDTKAEQLHDIEMSLRERPFTRPQLARYTLIDKTTVYWRIWDNHIDTDLFNEKSGKKQRLSETFCNIGKAPRGVAVIGLVNYPYPSTVVTFCVTDLNYIFNERLRIAEG
jgi:hypothetical protein